MARIGLHLISIERQSYLLAKMFALAGNQVLVHSEVPLPAVLGSDAPPGFSERRYFSWLYSDEDVQMLKPDGGDLPAVDLLIYEMGHPWPAQPERLSAWIDRASHVAAFHTHGFDEDFYHNHRADLARMVKYGRFLPRTRHFLLRGGRTSLRLPLIFARGALMGYFINPDFLRDPELRQSMFDVDWFPGEKRPIRIIFAGNPEPPGRRKIVEELTKWLSQQSTWPMIRSLDEWEQCLESSGSGKLANLWMVRGDPNDRNWEARGDSIPPKRWANVLKSTDFSICPPGYEAKTHRVIESLLCGSIPILDCPEEYDIGLKHEFNCLVVTKNDWIGVVSKALNYSPERIAAMREGVLQCRGRYLTLEKAGNCLARKCGLKTLDSK